MKEKIEVLIGREKVEERIKEIGKIISDDYRDKEITLVVTLNGAFMVGSDLSKNIDSDVKMKFIRAKSYIDEKSSGKVDILYDIDKDLTGKNILIVEDIIDTGHTLKYLKDLFIERGAEDVKIFALLNKNSRRAEDIQADYVGFDIDDIFVVGYGLDKNDEYRNLPYVGYIKQKRLIK